MVKNFPTGSDDFTSKFYKILHKFLMDYTESYKNASGNWKEGNTSQLILWGQHYPNPNQTNTWDEKNVTANIPHGHKSKKSLKSNWIDSRNI